jgi:hypothetical protein
MALYRLEWEQFLCVPLPSDDDDDSALMNGRTHAHELSGDPRIAYSTLSPSKMPSILQEAATIGVTRAESQSMAPSLNAALFYGSKVFHANNLILQRVKHTTDIQLGNLRNIKAILAESAAAMLLEEQTIIKQEAGDTMGGYGIRVFPDGTLYAGDFSRGVREGVGVLRWGNAHSYFGQWLDDVAHGRGEYRFPNGVVFIGIWDSGSTVGDGCFSSADGDVLDGKPAAIYDWAIVSFYSVIQALAGEQLQKQMQKTNKTSQVKE